MVGFHNSATATKKKYHSSSANFTWSFYIYLGCVHNVTTGEIIWGCFSTAGRQWPGQFFLRIAHCLDNASAQLVHDASEPSNPKQFCKHQTMSGWR